jgi:hypothetical protein
MIPWLLLVIQFSLLGLGLWGMHWRAHRLTPGPPPWWLRPVLDATGSPRLTFNYVMVGVSIVVLLVIVATAPPSHAQQQRQQLDRIEDLLREIRDAVRR